MSNLLSENPAALQMLFTDDIYWIAAEAEAKVSLGTEKVETNNAEAPAIFKEKDERSDFEYLGENNKYFLILINDPIHTRINPVHQEMLMKVMAAKKFELRDLAIVNLNRYYQADFNALKAFFTCNRIVLFGLDPVKIGLPEITLNKAGQNGSVKILATYSLEEMRNSPDKKREFWNIMKNF